MSSSRFPGKVLAPFRGEPLIAHAIRAVGRVLNPDLIVVLTSVEPSDDPLWAYLETLDCHGFRGPLDNVYDRFRFGLERFPAEWVLRICADSPLVQPAILREVISRASIGDCDLVTTTFPRTFPSGLNAELIRGCMFASVDQSELTDDDREHVTRFFYRNAHKFRIVNIRSGKEELADISLAVDTVDDFRRLESLSDSFVAQLVLTALPSGGHR